VTHVAGATLINRVWSQALILDNCVGGKMIRLSNRFYYNVFFLLTLLLIPAVFSTHPNACASEHDGLIFILDSSASMLDKVDGRAKIDILKEVMTNLVKELPDSLNVGLVVYGHRKEGDCKDVEQIIPLGPLDRDRLDSVIMGLKPKGKAPITLSILKVFEALETFKEKCTIVLVANCNETCTGNPCELVKRLKKIGIKFVMHVIGFGVSGEEKVQLSCIAEAGEGKYCPVKDAAEFLMATKNIIEFEPKPNGPALCVGAIKNGVSFAAHISVLKDGRIIGTGDTSISNPIKFYLVPGYYRISATDLSADWKQTQTAMVDFKGTELVQIFDFSEGYIKVRVVKNGLPADGYIYVRRPGTVEPVASGDTSDSNPVTIKLQPGTYDVAAFDPEMPGEPSLYFSDIKIKGGELLEKTINFGERTTK
jgi:Ca-activated chloride channel family protein